MEIRSPKKGTKITTFRRVTQFLVLISLIIVPVLSQNIYDWSPSEVVLGKLPPPAIFPVSGDTWCFSIGPAYICHPVAFLESIISTRAVHLSALSAATLPVLMTILLGRVFCSWLCPMGFIFELVAKINNKKKYIPWIKEKKLWDFRYIFAGILLLLSLLFGITLISVFDPPHALGRELIYLFTHHRLSVAGAGLLAIVLLIDLFVARRGWCRFICPSGGCLSILGMGRLLRLDVKDEICTGCGICSQVCQFGLDPAGIRNDNKGFKWSICDNCGICADNCPSGAIDFKMRGII